MGRGGKLEEAGGGPEGPGDTSVGVWRPEEEPPVGFGAALLVGGRWEARGCWEEEEEEAEDTGVEQDFPGQLPSTPSRPGLGDVLSSRELTLSSLLPGRLVDSSRALSLVSYILRITDVGVKEGDSMLVTGLAGEPLPEGWGPGDLSLGCLLR